MYTAILTGSRNYSSGVRIYRFLNELSFNQRGLLLIRAGDCPTGLDSFVKSWCQDNHTNFKEYTAHWDEHGKSAGPIRNGEMVSDGADICYAFPDDSSRGTKDCATQAREAGIRVVFPDLPEWAHWAVPLV
jgi:hypothetical protein